MKAMPQRAVLARTVSLIISSMTCAAVSADPIAAIQIKDVGSVANGIRGGGPPGVFNSVLDGNAGGFKFDSVGINPTTFTGVSGWIGDVGAGSLLGGGVANPTGSFSTGFLFSGAPFVPYAFGGNFVGDLTVDNAGNPSLNVSTLDFGGQFQSGAPPFPNFDLPPDSGTLNVNFLQRGANQGEFLVNFQWQHDITTAEDATGNYTSFTASWVLEGVLSVTDSAPVSFIKDAGGTPSAVSGDVTTDVLSNSPYTDPGAVCQDVFDGDISANVTTVPVNPDRANSGAQGSSFTVVYNCQDSGNNNATTVTRMVNVTNTDVVPPTITLSSPASPVAGRNDPDPATVNILQGTQYVDAGAACNDNVDGDISGGITMAGTVDINTPGSYTLTFNCSDVAGNAAVQQVRTVNVIADNLPPVITLNGANPLSVAVGSTYSDPGAACMDTNPIDSGPVDITANDLNINPTSIDTGSVGTTNVTYDCSDASGNPAIQQTRVVNVTTGSNFRILGMTITDMDGDGLAGCFRFNGLNPTTCDGAALFSSDDSGDPGSGGTARIPGSGDDKDSNGNPIGINFGSFQSITSFRDPNTPPAVITGSQVPIGPISPGFLFTQFPFVPTTFDPNTVTGGVNPEIAVPPSGFVTVTGPSSALVTLTSLPFGGFFNSDTPNQFFLDPDEGTFSGTITSINSDDNGTTRSFNYSMTWNHAITDIEDPTAKFNAFTAFWRLEGVITAESTSFVINDPPVVVSANASQDGRDPTTVIISDGGLVTASITASDLNNDTLTYDWSNSPMQVVGATDQSSVTFDPSNLPEGPLGLQVTISDGKDTVGGEITLVVAKTAPVLSGAIDSDGDGVNDELRGFGDGDFDGIPDYQDPVDGSVDPGRNRIDYRDPSRGDIVASAGQLRLGRTARARTDGTFVVREEDIQKFGGPGAKPTGNFHDLLKDVLGGVGPVPGGIRDFIVDNLSSGATVKVVIPQDSPLPSVPEYRKYTVTTGWVPFSRTSGNAWASAPKVAGICPGPADPAYDTPVNSSGQTEMVQGDECVRLTIVDGGNNDADRTRNGIIVDPGTVSGNGAASSAKGGCVMASNASGKGAHRGDWWMLLMGLLGLFGFNRRRNPVQRNR